MLVFDGSADEARSNYDRMMSRPQTIFFFLKEEIRLYFLHDSREGERGGDGDGWGL